MDDQLNGKIDVRETDLGEAVTDIAEVALQSSSSARGSVSQSIALLLQRLLLLCEAQKGAILLVEEAVAGIQTAFAAPGEKLQRIIAVQGMSEEEVNRRLLTFVPLAQSAGALKVALNTPCWAVCHLPLSVRISSTGGMDIRGDDLSPFQESAWFLVGWSDESVWQSRLERARELLPRVAAPVGVALLSLLQSERIREMETTPYHESVREMELLKAELLATVSHELRSPLASITGYTTTLLRHERRIAAQERHEFLLAIQEAGDRLHFIVDRFLEMSQLETESVKLFPALVDVERITQEAIGVLQSRLEGQKPGRYTFRIHVNNSSGEPTIGVPLLKADPRLLREVLDNLLENAVRYSHEGGLIEVTLQVVPAFVVEGKHLDHRVWEELGTAEKVNGEPGVDVHHVEPQSREMIEVCVCDRGMGIEKEHLERVFDRFYRVDTALTRSVGGLGLGLAISKCIVELHHGTIRAERRPGGGSIFCIRLPITDERAC